MTIQRFAFGLLSLLLPLGAEAAEPLAAPKVTSLTNIGVDYTVPKENHIVLKRKGITAIIVNNAAVDVPELPGHRAGYNGLASFLSRRCSRGTSLFPPMLGLTSSIFTTARRRI